MLIFQQTFANIGDRIFETIDWISVPEYSGYAVGYGLETAIGPIEMKYSWSPEQPKGFTWFSIDSVLIAILLIIIPIFVIMKSPSKVCCKTKP
jgi:hypothetical protein